MKSLLIIEDDTAMRITMCRWIRLFYGEDAAPTIIETSSIEEAREVISRASVDVVLMDLTLVPDHTADETIALLPELSREWPPIVVISGHEDAGIMRSRCLESGADEFISKMRASSDKALLCEKLDNAIARRVARHL